MINNLRVWWSSHIPIRNGDLERYPVTGLKEAKKKIDELISRDLANKFVTSNVGGLEEFNDGVWTEWEDENGDDIMEVMRSEE